MQIPQGLQTLKAISTSFSGLYNGSTTFSPYLTKVTTLFAAAGPCRAHSGQLHVKARPDCKLSIKYAAGKKVRPPTPTIIIFFDVILFTRLYQIDCVKFTQLFTQSATIAWSRQWIWCRPHSLSGQDSPVLNKLRISYTYPAAACTCWGI